MVSAAGPRPGTICFVTGDWDGEGREGEVGVGLAPASKLLARGGWQVHVLFCGDAEREPGRGLREALSSEGCAFHLLDDLSAPPGAAIPHFGGDDPTLVLGEWVLEALEALHAEHRLDLVELPAVCAPALWSIQAKAGGDALLDVRLAVNLTSTTRHRREENLQLRSTPRDLKIEFCERCAFERADVQLAPSVQMLDFARKMEWRVRDDAAVVPPRPDPESELPPERWEERVEALYRELLERPLPPRVAQPAQPATVTVAVAHYNHARFLPAALASLAAQTRPPDEVVVIDDGSTSEAARRVFSEQEASYPEWTFLRQENVGPSATRNRCLERAGGTYFLPFDSDNIATPGLIERLLQAMERNPSRAATTCHNLAFVEDDEIESGDFAFRYSPTGGPRLSGCLENVYGDTCALFRTESLRSVGGFQGPAWSPFEDWETFVGMTLRGLEIEVLPQPLFYYRTDSGGRLQGLTADPAVIHRQRVRLVDEYFADAKLSPRERRDLWECLLAFDRFVVEGVEERLWEQRAWHDSQMADLDGFREAQLEEQGTRLGAEVEAQRARAEAAEGELAALSAIAPRRLLRRAGRAVRNRLSRSSRTVP